MKKVLRPIGLILLSGTLCSTGQVFATDAKSEAVANIAQQKKQVTGTVIDAFGPVAGASVSVKGTSEGTITDMDGNFSIDVTPGSTLSISFIGYVTQEIKYHRTSHPACNAGGRHPENRRSGGYCHGYQKRKTRSPLCHE